MACFIPSSSFSSFFSSSSSSYYYHHYFGAFKELLFFSPYNIAALAFKQKKFFYRPSQQNMTTTPAMQRPYLPQRSYPSCSLRLPPCSRCSTPGPGGSSTPKSEAADSRSLLQRELATPRTRQQTTKGAAAMRPMRIVGANATMHVWLARPAARHGPAGGDGPYGDALPSRLSLSHLRRCRCAGGRTSKFVEKSKF